MCIYIYTYIYIYTPRYQSDLQVWTTCFWCTMYYVGGFLKWRYPWIPPNHPSHFIIIVLKLMVLVIPILGNTHIYNKYIYIINIYIYIYNKYIYIYIYVIIIYVSHIYIYILYDYICITECPSPQLSNHPRSSNASPPSTISSNSSIRRSILPLPFAPASEFSMAVSMLSGRRGMATSFGWLPGTEKYQVNGVLSTPARLKQLCFLCICVYIYMCVCVRYEWFTDIYIYSDIYIYIYMLNIYVYIYIYYVIFIYTCSYNMSIWVSVLKPMWYESLPNSSTSAHSMMKPKNHLQTKEIVKLPTNHGWIAWFSKTAIKWKDCQVPCRIFSIGEIDEMDTVYEGFSVTNADAQKK